MDEPHTLRWARLFTSWGIACIPLAHRNKLPLLNQWQKATVCDEGRLLKYFGSGWNNYGLVCGDNSHHLVVVDWDNPDAWMSWQHEHCPPLTFTVRTRAGIHLYYFATHIPEHKLKLSIDGEFVGDVLSTGSFVVGPGSTHPSGIRYEALNDCRIEGIASIDVLELPIHTARAAAVEHVAQVRGSALPQSSNGLHHLPTWLLAANQGNRNNMLFWCACRALDSGLSAAEVEQLLLDTAIQVGLTEREVAATLRSAGKQERQTPTTRPAPVAERRHERRPSTISDRARARARRMAR